MRAERLAKVRRIAYLELFRSLHNLTESLDLAELEGNEEGWWEALWEATSEADLIGGDNVRKAIDRVRQSGEDYLLESNNLIDAMRAEIRA